MTSNHVVSVSKQRQIVSGLATAVAVVAMIGLARDSAGAVVVVAVALAAAASALASPDARAAVANFIVGAGVFGTIAVVIANDGVPSGSGRLTLLFVVSVPAIALIASVTTAIARVARDQATEFERHLVTQSAALAFGVVCLVAVTLTIADLVGGLPNPPPLVYLVACVQAFALVLVTQRRRMS